MNQTVLLILIIQSIQWDFPRQMLKWSYFHVFTEHVANGDCSKIQQNSGKQITVRSDSGVMSDGNTKHLGVKTLQDESMYQISTNFKLSAALHLLYIPCK